MLKQAIHRPFDVTIQTPLRGRVIIDSSPRDDGYLANARVNDPDALADDSIVDACRQLGAGVSDKIIVGHGYRATVGCGTGNVFDDTSRYISMNNPEDWLPHIGDLGQCTSLTFFACHTGTAEEGAAFLFKLAGILQCPVAGPTGYICAWPDGGFTLEPTSTWQIARPNLLPQPIKAPSSYVPPADALALHGRDGIEALEWSRVQAVEVQPPARDVHPLLAVTGREAQRAVRAFRLSLPFESACVPGAAISARITIALNDGRRRQFELLNERLLRDTERRRLYYHCAPEILSLLLGAAFAVNVQAS